MFKNLMKQVAAAQTTNEQLQIVLAAGKAVKRGELTAEEKEILMDIIVRIPVRG